MTNTILQIKKEKILRIHKELSVAKNLKPSSKNNLLFSELVTIVQETPIQQAKKIINNKEIQLIRDGLRKISSKAEYELELFWVKQALKSANTEKILNIFPYYINYEKMIDLEIENLKFCNIHKNHKVLFVGSGPLPLSSIIMAKKYGISVDNLDLDKEACALSKKLIQKINLSNKINIIKWNILDIKDFSKYQIIFIAALAGDGEKEKTDIIDYVSRRCEKNTHIVMRSVNDLGTLLYPEITPRQLKNIEVKYRSKNSRDFINNIIIGTKK